MLHVETVRFTSKQHSKEIMSLRADLLESDVVHREAIAQFLGLQGYEWRLNKAWPRLEASLRHSAMQPAVTRVATPSLCVTSS